MYMLNMVIILIVMYCNVVTAIDKIPTYLLRFNSGKSRKHRTDTTQRNLTSRRMPGQSVTRMLFPQLQLCCRPSGIVGIAWELIALNEAGCVVTHCLSSRPPMMGSGVK